MKLIWISSASDNEFDVTRAIAKSDIDMDLYILKDDQDVNHNYHMSCLTRAPNINIQEVHGGDEIRKVLVNLTAQPKDLIVLRHPTWIPGEDYAKDYANILVDQPYIIYTWEWVPNYALGQMPPVTSWKRIAVTNSEDLKRAKLSFPDKQILYFPFGVVPWTDDELKPHEAFACDCVSDAQPHYNCGEYNAIKRYSVDKLVMPVTHLSNIKVNLWGSRYGETTIHDWGVIDQLKQYHAGHFVTTAYPTVYASSKIYLGPTWNYLTGGFSIRLARALGCGMMTIWQQTEGCLKDIPEPVLEWSNDFYQTKNLIETYLKNDERRVNMGRLARRWSLENWEWSKQLKRLAKEIN